MSKLKIKSYISILISTVILFSYLNLQFPKAESSDAPLLRALIFDRVYKLQATEEYTTTPDATGFAPNNFNYSGVAYRSVDAVEVYPFAVNNDATVTVNDQPLSEKKASVSLSAGANSITVKVSRNGQSSTYTVTVNKVDYDYRGRKPYFTDPELLNGMKVTTELGNLEKLKEIITKRNNVVLPDQKEVAYVNSAESYWEVPANSLVNATAEAPVTLFTIDFGKLIDISRIRAVFGPANLGLANRVSIAVSSDNKNWEVPVSKGNLNSGTKFHQNVVRYELGISHKARYLKFSVVAYKPHDKNLRIYQFMPFYDSAALDTVKLPQPRQALPHLRDERHKYLAGGQATVIERGIPLSGWTPSGSYGRGIPTSKEAREFGYDGPLFYDLPFTNKDYMLYNPDALWGIAKAPFGKNNMAEAGEPRDFIPDDMKPYINNALSFCFGDEGGYSKKEAEAFGKWFEWTRQHYPGVILHTNQFPSQWKEQNLREYLRIAQPDLLSWDDYYGDRTWANPSSIDLSTDEIKRNAARRLLNLPTWDTYRKLAYEGIDGTTAKPILWGQYLDAFAFNHSQSAKNIVVNTSLLSGAKWLNFFRLEYQFDRSYFWDEDGTPTRGLLEWGNIIKRVHAVDEQLTRLNNEWILFKRGTWNNGGNKYPYRSAAFYDKNNAENVAQKAEFGLQAVEASRVTGGSETGDVVIGLFKPLTGLYPAELAEHFKGATDPHAFMLMNGLIGGVAERYNAFNIPGRESGSAENTRQTITVTFDSAFASKHNLYLVNKDKRDEKGNGIVEKVTLQDGNKLITTLGGGEADLYFWDVNTTAAANSMQEAAHAAFAFDKSLETYWQADSTQDAYTLSNEFKQKNIDTIEIREKGANILQAQLAYKDEHGEWQDLDAPITTIGDYKRISLNTPVNAQGIKLTITNTKDNALPAIYDFKAFASGTTRSEQSFTVNDNVLGTGLHRFEYDNLWSYREKETNENLNPNIYPIDKDGHFSNFENAEAKFKFYGHKLDLHVRADQAANLKAAIFNEQDQLIGNWKDGVKNQGKITFSDFAANNQDAVYVLKIVKKNNSQAGIDGVKVYNYGEAPAEIKAKFQGPKAEQVYVNQITAVNQPAAAATAMAATDTATVAENYFTFEPAVSEELSIKQGNDNNKGFKEYIKENNGWVQHKQSLNNNNLGFTRTKRADSSYTLHFNGNGFNLYTATVPLDGQSSPNYASLRFELDGQDITEQVHKLDTAKLGKNGKISLNMYSYQIPDAQANLPHTIKVTNTDGYNRIDYAVVDRFAETVAPAVPQINVTVTGEGSYSQERIEGATVIIAKPAENAVLSKLIMDNVSYPLPADNRIVIPDGQPVQNVSLEFKASKFKITAEENEHGYLVPDKQFAAAGETVNIRVAAASGYTLVEGSIRAVAGDVAVEVTKADNTYSFVMPAANVTLSASWSAVPEPTESIVTEAPAATSTSATTTEAPTATSTSATTTEAPTATSTSATTTQPTTTSTSATTTKATTTTSPSATTTQPTTTSTSATTTQPTTTSPSTTTTQPTTTSTSATTAKPKLTSSTAAAGVLETAAPRVRVIYKDGSANVEQNYIPVTRTGEQLPASSLAIIIILTLVAFGYVRLKQQ